MPNPLDFLKILQGGLLGPGLGGGLGGPTGVGTPTFTGQPMNPFPGVGMPGMAPGIAGQTPGDPNDPLVRIRQLLAQLEAQENQQGPLGQLLGKIPGPLGNILGSPQFQQLALTGLAASKPGGGQALLRAQELKRNRKLRSQAIRGQLTSELAQLEALQEERKVRREERSELRADRERQAKEREQTRQLQQLNTLIRVNPSHPAIDRIAVEAGLIQSGESLSSQQRQGLSLIVDENGNIGFSSGSLTVTDPGDILKAIELLNKPEELTEFQKKLDALRGQGVEPSRRQLLKGAGFLEDPVAIPAPPTLGEKLAKAPPGIKEQISDLIGLNNDLVEILQLHRPEYTGVETLGSSLAKRTGIGLSKEKATFFALVERVKNLELKSRSGAAVSEQELQRLKQELANISDSDVNFTAKVQLAQRKVGEFIQRNFKLADVDPQEASNFLGAKLRPYSMGEVRAVAQQTGADPEAVAEQLRQRGHEITP